MRPALRSSTGTAAGSIWLMKSAPLQINVSQTHVSRIAGPNSSVTPLHPTVDARFSLRATTPSSKTTAPTPQSAKAADPPPVSPNVANRFWMGPTITTDTAATVASIPTATDSRSIGPLIRHSHVASANPKPTRAAAATTCSHTGAAHSGSVTKGASHTGAPVSPVDPVSRDAMVRPNGD